MSELFELGIRQVAAHNVRHPAAVVVRLKPAPMQRHQLLQLPMRRHRQAIYMDGHPMKQLTAWHLAQGLHLELLLQVKTKRAVKGQTLERVKS